MSRWGSRRSSSHFAMAKPPSCSRMLTAYRQLRNGGDRVEAAADFAASRGVVPVRDSKAANGPVVDFSASSFETFVAGVKAGQLHAS